VRLDDLRPIARVRRLVGTLLLVFLLVFPPLAACAGDGDRPAAEAGSTVLRIGGIPDQEAARMERMFGLMATYLSERTGLDVRYVPSNDYAAVVSGFQRGDLELAWFGGLTGVQAQAVTPESQAIAQRPRDAEFHSVFVTGRGVTANTLAELEGLSFTFGSESSTSGHLMPRHFLQQAGIDAEQDFDGPPGYSGSHDATYKLVEAGTYQAGALNEAVWQSAVAEARVDTTKVRPMYTTPAYFDYHWAVRGDVDERFGAGTRQRIEQALLELNASLGAEEAELLELFATDRFIPTTNENYSAIRTVAEGLGILR
jgi:phosphonate transport system substrate-binding protein